LDPACGSGSFLIGAYQYLLDWHRDWFVNHDPKKRATGRAPALYQASGGEWKLTTTERKRILLQNIFGVDIDAQAVETTKLSLLLKVLEGESEQSLATQLRFFHERALPDLGSNIKCGNSLIGPDFYDQQDMNLLDEDKRYRINVFDWDAEFPEIMKAGGCDAVIGNPPYLRVQGLQEHYTNQIDYFARNYQSAIKRFDLYLLFIERAYNLLGANGKVGFICPHKFLHSDFGSGLRQFLLTNKALETFVSFGTNRVFRKASTYTGILILSKGNNSLFDFASIAASTESEFAERLDTISTSDFTEYRTEDLTAKPWSLTSSRNQSLLDKLRRQPATVESVFDAVFQGVVTGIDDLYFVTKIRDRQDISEIRIPRDERKIQIENPILKPVLKGDDVSRYAEPRAEISCIYPYKLVDGKTVILEESELAAQFPLAYRYLSEFKSELRTARVKYKTNPRYWYSLHRGRSIAAFGRERIITQEISLGCNMTIDSNGLYHNTQVYSFLPSASRPE
jgi:adenine-specific DNA-methyltransferase